MHAAKLAAANASDNEQRMKAAEERLKGAVMAAQLRARRAAMLQAEAATVQRQINQYHSQHTLHQQQVQQQVPNPTPVSQYCRQIALAHEEPQAHLPVWMLVRQPDRGLTAIASRILRENRFVPRSFV